MQLSIVIVRALVQELGRRGVAAEQFCAAVGLDEASLDDASFRIDLDAYDRLVEHAIAITRDPQLGLHVGANAPSSTLTVFGHLVSSCRTLRDAAEVLFRYGPILIEGATFRVEPRGDLTALCFELPDELSAHRAYGAELCMAVIFKVILPFVPENEPVEIRFAHEPTGPLVHYERVFGGPVSFDAGENALIGPTEALDRPQFYADESLREMLRRRAEGLLAELQSEENLPHRVRDFLLRQEQPMKVTAALLAEAFGMSERTLRRKLGEQGTSLRDLVDATLRQMACAALEEAERRPIKDVATRLGFSELSGFYRAFKRWTGVTPAEFREGKRAPVEP